MNDVQQLLTRAADEAGEFPAPTADSLRLRARRQRRLRTFVAAASVVVLVAGLAVALSLRTRQHPATAQRFSPSELPGPSGPVVTAEQLKHYHWNTLPPMPISGRYDAATVWTGSKLLVWGGSDGTLDYSDGAAYDPGTRTWEMLPASPLASRESPAFAWVDGSLVVWAGSGPSVGRTDGARYDTRTSAWSVLPPAPMTPGSQVAGFAVGSGFVAITDDGSPSPHVFHAARFDLVRNAWTRLPDLTAPRGGTWSASGVSAGDTLLVWLSEWLHSPDRAVSVAWQDDRWVATPYDGVRPTTAYWTGRSIVVPSQQATCEICPIPNDEPGAVLDVATGHDTTIPDYHGSLPGETFAWTGGAVLKVYTSHDFLIARDWGTAGAWNPSTNMWISVPSAPIVKPTGGAVWTGDRLLVVAGAGSRIGVEFAP